MRTSCFQRAEHVQNLFYSRTFRISILTTQLYPVNFDDVVQVEAGHPSHIATAKTRSVSSPPHKRSSNPPASPHAAAPVTPTTDKFLCASPSAPPVSTSLGVQSPPPGTPQGASPRPTGAASTADAAVPDGVAAVTTVQLSEKAAAAIGVDSATEAAAHGHGAEAVGGLSASAVNTATARRRAGRGALKRGREGGCDAPGGKEHCSVDPVSPTTVSPAVGATTVAKDVIEMADSSSEDDHASVEEVVLWDPNARDRSQDHADCKLNSCAPCIRTNSLQQQMIRGAAVEHMNTMHEKVAKGQPEDAEEYVELLRTVLWAQAYPACHEKRGGPVNVMVAAAAVVKACARSPDAVLRSTAYLHKSPAQVKQRTASLVDLDKGIQLVKVVKGTTGEVVKKWKGGCTPVGGVKSQSSVVIEAGTVAELDTRNGCVLDRRNKSAQGRISRTTGVAGRHPVVPKTGKEVPKKRGAVEKKQGAKKQGRKGKRKVDGAERGFTWSGANAKRIKQLCSTGRNVCMCTVISAPPNANLKVLNRATVSRDGVLSRGVPTGGVDPVAGIKGVKGSSPSGVCELPPIKFVQAPFPSLNGKPTLLPRECKLNLQRGSRAELECSGQELSSRIIALDVTVKAATGSTHGSLGVMGSRDMAVGVAQGLSVAVHMHASTGVQEESCAMLQAAIERCSTKEQVYALVAGDMKAGSRSAGAAHPVSHPPDACAAAYVPKTVVTSVHA